MTRDERLAHQEAVAKERARKDRVELHAIQARRREEARKARMRRYATVGKLAEQSGLFSWDDATLMALFQMLALLTDTPNPVAVLEGLLSDGRAGLVGAVVDACGAPVTSASLSVSSLTVSRGGDSEFSPLGRNGTGRG